jgi:hypothetical protein
MSALTILIVLVVVVVVCPGRSSADGDAIETLVWYGTGLKVSVIFLCSKTDHS